MSHRVVLLSGVCLMLSGCPGWFGLDPWNLHPDPDTGAFPTEPAEDCQTRLLDCLDAGFEPDRCEARFDHCLRGDRPDVDPPAPGSEPHDTAPPPDDCDDALRRCLAEGRPPDRCHARHDACTGEPVQEDPCEALGRACLDLGLPAGFCAEQVEGCHDVHGTDPCDDLALTCLDLGLDPAYCRDQHAACASAAP